MRFVIHSLSDVTDVNGNKMNRFCPQLRSKALKSVSIPGNFALNFHVHNFKSC